jgi:hypothetical protein
MTTAQDQEIGRDSALLSDAAITAPIRRSGAGAEHLLRFCSVFGGGSCRGFISG